MPKLGELIKEAAEASYAEAVKRAEEAYSRRLTLAEKAPDVEVEGTVTIPTSDGNWWEYNARTLGEARTVAFALLVKAESETYFDELPLFKKKKEAYAPKSRNPRLTLEANTVWGDLMWPEIVVGDTEVECRRVEETVTRIKYVCDL